MTTAAAPPADQKIRLPDEIWPGINAMMHSDAYFMLWLKAQRCISKLSSNP